jgi:hypothetical protein
MFLMLCWSNYNNCLFEKLIVFFRWQNGAKSVMVLFCIYFYNKGSRGRESFLGTGQI